MKVVKWIHPNELDEQKEVYYCGFGRSYIDKYTEADYDSGRYTEERSEGALYRKTEEYHCQRAYSTEEVKNLLQASGMRFLGAWDGYTRNPVSANTERVLYMAQEQGKEK